MDKKNNEYSPTTNTNIPCTENDKIDDLIKPVFTIIDVNQERNIGSHSGKLFLFNCFFNYIRSISY